MKHSLLAQSVWTFVLLAGASTAAADSEGDAIAAALAAARPSLPMAPARLEALKRLDAWIARPRSERTEPCIAYYQAAVDRALDALEHQRVASGVRIFQLYSSSVIVQTPETVFAFDLAQGPPRHADETSGNKGMEFRMTDLQIARLVKLIAYSFHTHEHGDHIDAQLAKSLLAAGKTVIVTENNKKRWQEQPWADKLTVLKQTIKAPVDVGPLKVDVLCDHQWNNTMHTSGTPCNAFVVTTPGGVAVMTKGDINCGLQLYGWLSLLKQRGQRVDVVVGSSIFWKGVGTLAGWNALFEPLWLPGHNWEFTHRGENEATGNCGRYALSWRLVQSATRIHKAQVLSWGEWLDVCGGGRR
jgi:L-ascorbate metabolism protein UlaG (beta-lactamase superfamily)